MHSGFFELYLIIINIITFIVFMIDKMKAVTNSWRIRERVLLVLAFIGGAPGAYLSMKLLRHKTQTPIFKSGVPLLLIIQLAVFLRVAAG